MISSQSITSRSRDGSKAESSGPSKVQTQSLHQDDQGPLDCELLDLYVAILIAVPLACLLRFLWA